jgi:hypothetical protein
MSTLHAQFQSMTRGIVKRGLILGTLLAVASLVSAGTAGKTEVERAPQIKSGESGAGEIALPGLKLKRGDPRDRVIRELSRLYELQQLKSSDGEEDSWLITEKAQHDNYLGVVSFANGKIRRVARFRKWTQDEDSVELAQKLCDLIEQLTGKPSAHLEVTAKTNDSGKYTVRGIEMISGDKRISLNLISRADESDPSSRQVEVHLDEVVQ